MASLPSQHPTLSLHLSDATLTPLITSAASQSHLESLTQLTSSAIAAHTAASRLGLGRPLRLIAEFPDRGPVVLSSYLDPRDAASAVPGETAAQIPADATHHQHKNSHHHDHNHSHSHSHKDDARSEDAAPMLVGIVVAGTADESREARRAAARLERLGKDFQREWVTESAERDPDDSTERGPAA